MLLWQIYVAGKNKTYVRLQVTVPDTALEQRDVHLLM
jgi:hypothetical protein